MARKPTAAERKAFGERMAAARAAARAKRDAGGAPQPPPQAAKPMPETDARPAFMQDAPQPEARPQPAAKAQTSEALRAAATSELVTLYAGAHFMPAMLLGVPDFQVNQEEAEAVCGKFVRMMEAWGYPVDDVFAGKWGATLSFGSTFLMVEFFKLRALNAAMAQRAAEARAQAEAQAQAEAAATPQDFGPAPGAPGSSIYTGVHAMERPFDTAAE